MKKRLPKRVPKFENEEQERKFWASHDSADYLEWQRRKLVTLPNLRPTSRTELKG